MEHVANNILFSTLLKKPLQFERDVEMIFDGWGVRRPILRPRGRPAGQVTNLRISDVKRLKALDFVLWSGYEGLSHMLLEAMRAGRAIIASDSGGNPELIENGRNGVLVPWGQTQEFGRAISELCRNVLERERLEREATAASARFTLPARLGRPSAPTGRHGPSSDRGTPAPSRYPRPRFWTSQVASFPPRHGRFSTRSRRVQKYKRTQDQLAGTFRNRRVYAWLANGS